MEYLNMLINVTQLFGEIRKSTLIALSEATNPQLVPDEEFKRLEEFSKALKDVQIILEQHADIVVEVIGDEYFTMEFPR